MNGIKQAFEKIKADEKMKTNTKISVLQIMHEKQEQKGRTRTNIFAVAAACVILFCTFVGYNSYFTATSIISIDINPSIELEINRFDRVMAVKGYNEDGKKLAETLSVMHMDYEKAVQNIISSDTVTECLERNELLEIAVVEIDPEQGEEILNYVSECTSGNGNMHCYGLTSDYVAPARSSGLSCGKYAAYEQLSACGVQVSPEEVAKMTMREIRELIAEIQSQNGSGNAIIPEDELYPGNGGNGNGSGNGNGNANGNVNSDANDNSDVNAAANTTGNASEN